TNHGLCAPPNLPNLVLLISDDQAYCDYGFMGVCRSPKTGTPLPAPYTLELDNLADNGRLFTWAHSGGPICQPALQTILTGKLLPPRPPAGKAPCDPSVILPPGGRCGTQSIGSQDGLTIPQFLRPFGYCTAQVGKLYTGGGKGL